MIKIKKDYWENGYHIVIGTIIKETKDFEISYDNTTGLWDGNTNLTDEEFEEIMGVV